MVQRQNITFFVQLSYDTGVFFIIRKNCNLSSYHRSALVRSFAIPSRGAAFGAKRSFEESLLSLFFHVSGSFLEVLCGRDMDYRWCVWLLL